MTDETTPLRLTEPERSYMYLSARNRTHKSKLRQFQCCIGAAILGIFVVVTVITVAYVINHDADHLPPLNETNAGNFSLDLMTLLTATWPLIPAEPTKQASPRILWSPEENDNAIKAGRKKLAEVDQMEKDNPVNPLPLDHPSTLHAKSIMSTSEAGEASRVGSILVEATKDLANKKYGGFWKKGRKGPRIAPNDDWIPKKYCPEVNETLNCKPSPYRTINGTCNNLKNTEYGVIMRPFIRSLPAVYSDGISKPRRSVDGSELPNARKVSLTVHRPIYRNDPKFTVMLAVWGQFVDHDFTATAASKRRDGSTITCCNSKWQHPECFPVHIEELDPFYQQYNVTCIDFVRSAPAPTCALGPREQFSQVTPFIDGSVVYGANDELASSLRYFKKGYLEAYVDKYGRELLPVDKSLTNGCNQEEEAANGRYCFRSGDSRANENVHLTSLHLIFARQHNKLAAKLARINPSWDDEKLYQEARKIVGAQLQHVTYNEFLPIVLGPELSDKLDINPTKSGYYHGYDEDTNPQIANEFASSAFRFGHTLLQGLIKFIENDHSSPEYVQMHRMLFNPFGLYNKNYMSGAIRGALQTDIQKADPYFSTEVSQKLFQRPNGPCGLDLVTLNVQRGRDHGLPPYTAFRERCGLWKPQNFEDLESIMDSDTVYNLQQMYKNVDDIDFYTGIVSENPMEWSGLLGPTATCIIGDQFVRFKRGDRYWYETPEKPQAFTPAQLNEIKKTTLAGLLCDNTEELTESQAYAMRSISPENPMMLCSEISTPDLRAWSENGKVDIPTTNEIKPRKHIYDLIIKVRVKSGSITGSYGALDLLTLWDGNIPAAIPYPYLDYPQNISLPIPKPDDIQYRGGILWGGKIDINSPQSLYISANYHLPMTPLYVRDRKIKEWWCGEGELDMEIQWNNTELFDIPLANYFTPILFVREGVNLTDETFDQIVKPLLKARVARDPLDPTTLPRLPLLIKGTYSEDYSTFYWNGEAYLMLSPQTPAMSELQLSSSGGVSAPMQVLGTVTEGSISMNNNIIWNGNLPLDISINQPIDDVGLLQIGTALLNLKLSVTDTGDVLLNGNISLAESNNEPENWNTGSLSVKVNVDPIIPLLNYVKSYMCVAYVFIKDKGNILMSSNPGLSDPNGISSLNQVIIILEGETINNETFRWNGKIKVKILPPYENARMVFLRRSNNRLGIGGQVTNGKITSYNGGMPKSLIYDGIKFPVEIPLSSYNSFMGDSRSMVNQINNLQKGNGVLWKGTITFSNDSKQIEAVGDFRLPIFKDRLNKEWTLGHFKFIIDIKWNSTSLDNLNITSPDKMEYFSRVELRSDGSTGVNTTDNSTIIKQATNVTIKPFEFNNDDVTISPVILHGVRNKSVFLWYGEITIILH